MADMLSAVDTYLRSDTSLMSSLTGGLWPIRNTDTTPTYPYCSYMLIDDPCEPEAFDNTDAGQARIQFDVVCSKKADRSILLDIKDLLQHTKSITTVSVGYVEVSGMRDIVLTNSLYQFQMDVIIEYAN